MRKNKTLVAVGLLLAATISWGGMFPVAKSALPSLDPYYMTLIRYGLAALVFPLFLVLREGWRAFSLEGRPLTLFFLGALGFAGFNLLAFAALVHTRPEHGAVIMATMPMITVLLTWLLKGVRPKGFTLAMVALAFAGVFLVITGGHPTRAFGGGQAKWDLLFLGGAFCWVSYTMGAQLFPAWSPLRYTTITCAFGAAAIGAVTLLLTWNHSISTPTFDTLVNLRWTIAYLVVLGALVAVLSWNSGIRMLGAVNGVLFINFVPITAFVIGVVLGHAFGVGEILGAILVISALVANNLHLRRVEKVRRLQAAGV
jgi:drug/metabolite transporter (DMT)-like permease